MGSGPIPYKDKLTTRQASATYGINPQLIFYWVRRRRLAVEVVPGRAGNKTAFLMDPADIGPLVEEYRVRKAKRQAQTGKSRPRVNLGTCRPGLEPDAVDDARSPCDAVAGTLLHEGLVLTPGDQVELSRRREKFAARMAA